MRKLNQFWQRFVNSWTTRRVAIILLALALLSIVLGSINQYGNDISLGSFIGDFYANAGTELVSIAITVLVIDALNERRATQQEKDALILQMGSPINSVSREAIRKLRTRGWLKDGTLRGASLSWANLQNAFLSDANMADMTFYRTKLHGAHLQWSNLQGAKGLTDEQLVYLHNLRGATMPDGHIYDGRYKLKRDLTWMQHSNVDVNDAEAAANFYGVSLEAYLNGQKWAEENLIVLRQKVDLTLQWENEGDFFHPPQTIDQPITAPQQDYRLVSILLNGLLIGVLLTKLMGERWAHKQGKG